MTFDEETGVYTDTFKSPLRLFISKVDQRIGEEILDPRPIPDLTLKFDMEVLRDSRDFEGCFLKVEIKNNGADIVITPKQNEWDYLSEII